MDYVSFERQLLRLMFTTNAPLTPVHVAYHLDLPIAEAKSHLDYMVSAGVLELDSDDGGHIVYSYPLRPRSETLPDPLPPRKKKKKRSQALIPAPPLVPAEVSPTPIAATVSTDMFFDDRRYSAAAAAALSFFLPGVGQIYSGRVPQGIGWMIATGLGYLLFLVPGLILHICCIVNAAAVPSRLPVVAETRR
jgi:TM2 domain-containing membrane protein YozV